MYTSFKLSREISGEREVWLGRKLRRTERILGFVAGILFLCLFVVVVVVLFFFGGG